MTSNLSTMTTCSFRGRSLKLNQRDDATVVVKEMQNIDVMHALELVGNTLGVEAAAPIAQHLQTRPELKEALFSDLFTGE